MTDTLAAPTIDRADDLQVGIALASVGFYVSGMGAVLAGLASEFSVAPESLSWVGSTFGAGLLVIAATGRLVLRAGPRPALATSAIALALSTLLAVFGPTLVFVFIAAVLQGLAASVMVLVAPVMLTASADVRLTRVNAVSSLVGILAPLLVGAAVSAGIPGRWALLTLVPLLAWLLVLLIVHARAGGSARAAEPTLADEDAPSAAAVTKPSVWSVVRRWLAVVMSVSVEFSYVVWGVTRLITTGVDTGLASVLGIAFPVGMAVGRSAGPWIIRRLPAVPFGAGVAALGTLLVVIGTGWPIVTAGLVIAGLGVATMYPVTLARLMAVEGLAAHRGAAVGAAASGTAILLAPVALAAVASVVDLRLAFLLQLPLLVILLVLHGRTEPRTGSDS